eukprot:COSAG06_NODE_69613_length_197_cov_15.061224_1_plen_61_part_01
MPPPPKKKGVFRTWVVRLRIDSSIRSSCKKRKEKATRLLLELVLLCLTFVPSLSCQFIVP